jgi:hypothetical protein
MAKTPKHYKEIIRGITGISPLSTDVSEHHLKHVRKVQTAFRSSNVVGIGASYKTTQGKPTDTLSITFYVKKKLPRSRIKSGNFLPEILSSHKGRAVFTDVKETGVFRPSDAPLVQETPIESGYSVSNITGATGTVGAIVSKPGQTYRYLLSNSHVLANAGLAPPGSNILYPGVADGGNAGTDWVAVLDQSASLTPGGAYVNQVDAALAGILDSRTGDLSFVIYGAGSPIRFANPEVGMSVMKRGRTSGETIGQVTDVDFHFSLAYPGIGTCGFFAQALCTRFTEDGDSGSLVLDQNTGNIVGLHFAHANGGSVFNPIRAVINALSISFASS